MLAHTLFLGVTMNIFTSYVYCNGDAFMYHKCILYDGLVLAGYHTPKPGKGRGRGRNCLVVLLIRWKLAGWMFVRGEFSLNFPAST